nr:hypothetical protein [Brevundimonas naejangsanensis]
MTRTVSRSEVAALKVQANAMLAPFFNGRGAAPIINQPAPKRPAPARELVAC